MCAAENAPARDGRPRTAAAAAAGGLAAAVVRLLAVAVCGRVAAAAPASVQGTLEFRLNSPDFNRYEGDCPVSVQLGQRSAGGMLVTVSAPGRCRCEELTLSVLQHRGIPCAPDAERCAWMTAHTASPDSRGAATFLVSVGGLFRPRALCRPPRAGEAKSDRPSMLRLFDGDPVNLAELLVDLSSWNVSISASVRGEVLEVRVRKQQHSGRTVSYFPNLVVTLYGPPESPGYPAPRLDQRSVAFLPETHGARAEFPVPPGGLYHAGYRVDVRPGGSWVCRGANEGCQRRYAMVQELLELTEQARSDGSIVA